MKETVYLPTPGAIPGIPGNHGPGLVEIDYEARTVTPVVEEDVAPSSDVSTQPASGDAAPLVSLNISLGAS